MELPTVRAGDYVDHNTIKCNAAISACVSTGGRSRAYGRVEQNTVLYNEAPSACEKGGERLGAVALSAATSTGGQAGSRVRAMELPAVVAYGRVEQYTITYSAAISACDSGGEWSRDMDL